MDLTKRDVIVIGGGFYGCFVAYQIALRFPGIRISLLEKENALFTRGSSTNQGQLHKGYMYSVDPELAAECARSVVRFEENFCDAIDHDVTAYYAVHRDSEIEPAAYEDFCHSLSLPMRQIDRPPRHQFGADAAAVYATAEKTFDSARLQAILRRRMAAQGVEVRLSHDVHHVEPLGDGSHAVVLGNGDVMTAGIVYNTSFADINALHDRSGFARVPIRCEVFLHFLLGLGPEYAGVAISVIRGYFASVMPSTFRGGHLLAAAGFRKIGMSDTTPISEYLDERAIREIYARSVDGCADYLPVLRRATYLGHVIGTRAAFIDRLSGETTSRVTPLLDFCGMRNYHVMVGGKVACLYEALEPALQGALAAGFAPA